MNAMPRRSFFDPLVQRALVARATRKRTRDAMALVQRALAERGAGTLGAIARAADLGLQETGRAIDRLLVEGAIELAGEGVYAIAKRCMEGAGE